MPKSDGIQRPREGALEQWLTPGRPALCHPHLHVAALLALPVSPGSACPPPSAPLHHVASLSRRLPAPSCLLCTAPPVLAARIGLLLPLPRPLVVPDSGWRLASRVGTCTGHTQRSRAGPRDMEPAVASNLGSWADLEHREQLLGGFPLAIICLLWCKALGGPT